MSALTIDEAAQKLGITAQQLAVVVNGEAQPAKHAPGPARRTAVPARNQQGLNPDWWLDRTGQWTNGRITLGANPAAQAALEKRYLRWCHERGHQPVHQESAS